MGDRKRPWVKDMLVFGAFTLLNAILLCIGFGLFVSTGFGPITTGWLWVFCFPASVAAANRITPLASVLLWLNPLIYGAMGWLAWKMFRLMRPNPPGDESTPSHRE